MKMKGKRIIAAALASLMMFSLASCANKEDADDGCIYGKISSVDGNDIVIQLAEYSESTDTEAEKDTDSKAEDDTSRSGKSGKSGRPQNMSLPDGFDPSQFSGSMPDGFDPSQFGNFDPSGFKGRGSDESGSTRRERPESFDGSLPDGFDPSQFGNMPGVFDPSQFDGSLPEGFDPSQFGGKMPSGFGKSGGSSQTIKGDNGSYTLTGEQKELRIPVGVTVTTSAGVKTGFDALSEGDIIKVKVEKDSEGQDVVTEVWIMEQ